MAHRREASGGAGVSRPSNDIGHNYQGALEPLRTAREI